MPNMRVQVRLPKLIIDGHTHFRGFRHRYKSTILQVLKEALKRKISISVGMPNPDPPITNVFMLTAIIKQLEFCEKKLKMPQMQRVWFGATDDNLADCEIALKSGRVVGIKIYPSHPDKGLVTTGSGRIGVAKPEVTLPQIMKLVRRADKTVAVHAADPILLAEKGEDTIEGELKYGKMVVDMAWNYPGVKIWMCHVSNRDSAELFMDAQDKGMRLIIELAMHYLWFSRDGINMNPCLPTAVYKCFNGLRSSEHMEYLRQLPIKRPKQVVFSSDDARHTRREKWLPWNQAPGGFAANQHLVPAVVTLGFEQGWPEELLWRMLSYNASQFLGISVPDDLVAVEFELRPDDTIYNGGNVFNPWGGLNMLLPVL